MGIKRRGEIGCIFVDKFNSSGLCTFNTCAGFTKKDEKKLTQYVIDKYVKPFNGKYYDVSKYTYADHKTVYLSKDQSWNKEDK